MIIPVHNEQDNLIPLFKRLLPILKPHNYELIFIDDGSTDSTLNKLKQLARKNKQIKVLSFNRNFGHQTALICGYEHAQGDCIITMDADLQDPPEVITAMLNKWQQGADIVYAQRKTRNDPLIKKVCAYVFYRLLNFLSDTPIPADVGDFRLQDKKVNQFLKKLPEHNKFLRGLVSWGGFQEMVVEFDRDKRHAGSTHYSFSKMINLALDGVTSFTTKPLRLASYLGFLTSLIGLLGISYALYRRIFLPDQFWVTGWTAIFVAVLFIGGIQLITIGIIGEYIGKMYRETQNRPSYLLKEKINL